MKDIKIDVRVVLATRKMKLGEILKLTEGSIIEFPKSVNEEIPLYVDNMEYGSGTIVKINGRFGLQIKSLLKER